MKNIEKLRDQISGMLGKGAGLTTSTRVKKLVKLKNPKLPSIKKGY